MTQAPEQPRAAQLRRRLGLFLRPVLLLSMAGVLQLHRMPLVAAVVAAAAVASVAGVLNTRLDVGWGWNDGPWRVGDRQPLSVRIGNPRARASAPAVLQLSAPGIAPVVVPVPALAPGERIVLGVDLVLVGRQGVQPLTVKCQVHNRLLGGARSVPVGGCVLPVVRPRPDLPPPQLLRTAVVAADEGFSTGKRGGADPLLMRAFVAGDPVSSVHWRSTARAGTPIVLEREQLGTGRVVLLVAGTPARTQKPPGPAERHFEAGVARAAGLVQAAQVLGLPVSVVSSGPVGLPAVAPHQRVQDWLAGLDRTPQVEPQHVEDAVRRADGGVIALLGPEPWVVAEVRRLAPHATVLDLAEQW